MEKPNFHDSDASAVNKALKTRALGIARFQGVIERHQNEVDEKTYQIDKDINLLTDILLDFADMTHEEVINFWREKMIDSLSRRQRFNEQVADRGVEEVSLFIQDQLTKRLDKLRKVDRVEIIEEMKTRQKNIKSKADESIKSFTEKEITDRILFN